MYTDLYEYEVCQRSIKSVLFQLIPRLSPLGLIKVILACLKTSVPSQPWLFQLCVLHRELHLPAHQLLPAAAPAGVRDVRGLRRLRLHHPPHPQVSRWC